MNGNSQQEGLISEELKIRPISDLLDEKFNIPRYQRGYRWGKQEIWELLGDISEYADLNQPGVFLSPGKFYCLQPVVVKKNNDVWDLIDGQQRLTTVFVILTYLNDIRKFYDKKENIYSITFETRNKCADFLHNRQFIEKIDESNVDFYYISKCYEYIKEWFDNNDNSKKRLSILQILLNPHNMPNVSVIWYEVKEGDPIAIFTRLNLGKIPLTDAELIKALLLQNDRYHAAKREYAKQRLFEIASEWDEITAGFQNENMWYFLNNPENKYISRIELIFDILAENWNEKLKMKISKDAKHFPYLVFHHYIEQKRENTYSHQYSHQIETINDIWRDIKEIYSLFVEWYNDRELYHYIGYLVVTTESVNLKELLELSRKSDKNSFVRELRKKIGRKIKISNEDGNNLLSDLVYGENNKEIIRILLLFNIETIIKDEVMEESRFPFHLYKNGRISIEHIHPQNPEKISENDVKAKEWLSSHLQALQEFPNDQKGKCKDIIEIIERLLGNYKKEDFEKVFELYNELAHIEDREKHTLYNLALVDQSVNSALNNSFFDRKRSLIKEMGKNQYIPICTRRVFDKYYTDYPTDMIFWGDADRKAYFIEIEKVYNWFINFSDTGEK
jgi:uncharacterized protein with ParB-like and HNH nuclease domain